MVRFARKNAGKTTFIDDGRRWAKNPRFGFLNRGSQVRILPGVLFRFQTLASGAESPSRLRQIIKDHNNRIKESNELKNAMATRCAIDIKDIRHK